MKNYFIHPNFGKIIIIYNYKNDTKEFYIEENDILFEPSQSELKEIENLFKKPNDEIWYSELLKNSIENNPKIDFKEYILTILEALESIIPEKYRENLYRNIKKLEIDFHSKSDTNSLYEGEYNIKNNKIKIYESFIQETWNKIPQDEKSEETYNCMFLCSVVHELLHMTSSKYDPENETLSCGFDNKPYKKESDKNRGLTEGFTELIAFQMSGNPYERLSAYMVQALLANQLRTIIGNEVMIESYFGNLGIKQMEDELQEIVPNKELSYNLFRDIDNSYWLNNSDLANCSTSLAQTTLITYFFAKISKEINESSTTVEEINNQIKQFEAMLITEEKLKMNGKDPKLYLGIKESVEYFYNQKETYLSILKQEAQVNI